MPVAMPNWHYLHIPTTCCPRCGSAGVTDEQITTMLVDNPRRVFATRAVTEMAEATPPISTQLSRLAAADPDAPAVTCAGRTLTRRELDASTNRLARAFAERGVGLGDYVTIVLPNSIEWLQAVIAAGSSAQCRSRCRRGCPTPSSRACCDLRPRALIVGRD